jgi:hypothetical protein
MANDVSPLSGSCSHVFDAMLFAAVSIGPDPVPPGAPHDAFNAPSRSGGQGFAAQEGPTAPSVINPNPPRTTSLRFMSEYLSSFCRLASHQTIS